MFVIIERERQREGVTQKKETHWNTHTLPTVSGSENDSRSSELMSWHQKVKEKEVGGSTDKKKNHLKRAARGRPVISQTSGTDSAPPHQPAGQ